MAWRGGKVHKAFVGSAARGSLQVLPEGLIKPSRATSSKPFFSLIAPPPPVRQTIKHNPAFRAAHPHSSAGLDDHWHASAKMSVRFPFSLDDPDSPYTY